MQHHCNNAADIIERFQLSIYLLLIIVHNASDLTWNFTIDWLQDIVGACLVVFVAEIFIDWIKHGFVTKFNGISFQVYDKFMRVLRADLLMYDRYVRESSA
jgi:transmembrane anterior posterior transformation protein 1